MNSLKTISGVTLACFSISSFSASTYPKDYKYDFDGRSPTVTMRLPVTTQGPFWPPGAMMDDNGDFVVVGAILAETEDGAVVPAFGSAAIVSKNTVPPLDENSQENFANPFGAPYSVVRDLDISPGSDDLDLVLYTNSYGPAVGNFGGGPRIPQYGESRYNLNGFHMSGKNCPELFPASSQAESYMRPSFALHEAPIWGFQGDGITYDVDTGEENPVRFKNGADCPADGCEGEDQFHSRRPKPITLGEWLEAKVYLTITLKNRDHNKKAYTSAKFNIRASGLLPNSIYTVVALRQSFLSPRPLLKLPTAATPAAHIISNSKGRGRLSFTIENPFPAPETDDAGVRIVGLGVAYKSDFSTYGACSLRFGAGVDIHAVAVSTADGTFDFTDFTTVASSRYEQCTPISIERTRKRSGISKRD